MADSTGAANAVTSDLQGPTLAGASMDSPPIQYSMILDHLIGEKRSVKDLNPSVMGGLPMPMKSDEQKMIERGMESCAFKSVLACVGGQQLLLNIIIRCSVCLCVSSFIIQAVGNNV